MVASHGEREAMVERATGRRWTYAQFDALALGMIATGVQTEVRVGIWSPTCAEWVVVQYATAKIGAVLVNVNPAYRSHELGFVVRQSGMRLIVSAVSHRSSDYQAMLEQIRPDCPELVNVAFIATASWAALVDSGSAPGRDVLAARMDPLVRDHIDIQYTSGTTRFPKGDPEPPQHPQQ